MYKTKRSTTTTITARVPVKLKARLQGLAKLKACPTNNLVLQALESFLQEDQKYLASVEAGMRDDKAGRVVPHSEVKRWLQSWGTDEELPPPQCK